MAIASWRSIDAQMLHFRDRLISELKIDEGLTDRIATSIAAEVRFLQPTAKLEIRNATPVPISKRIEELQAFQQWMDVSRTPQLEALPSVIRAKVITQNYICFVYLPESCFSALKTNAPVGSVTRRCAKFLTDHPVRSFRNAIAHANWSYRDDFSGLKYWARRGPNRDDPLEEFSVSQEELGFWQSLSRCVAYAGLSNL